MKAFEELVTVIEKLRKECPWDREQTFDSLRMHTLEEAHELSQSILEQDYEEMEKEMGDLWVHLLLYTEIAQEQQLFTLESLLQKAKEKLIFRHPHIYGDQKNQTMTVGQVKKNWEIQKIKEGRQKALAGLPKSLDPMIKAARMQEKLAARGFEKEEKYNWFLEENLQKDPMKIGEFLFELIQYARKHQIDPTAALEKYNLSFQGEWEKIENQNNN